MSGQWEVVSKKKDKVTKQIPQKITKETKKKNIISSPKIEDVLPMSQVKNLYKVNKNNKENQKPQEKSKVQENETKKVQKKVEKQRESVKPKPPKSIESALNSIDVEDLRKLYEKTKTLFPEAPIVWLKEVAQYLNQKMPVEVQDPVFSNKQDGYPYLTVPNTIRSILEKSILEAGSSSTQLFFDIALTTMATDMSKGLSALGHKLYLQYIAMNYPKIANTNVGKHCELRNSYQNRQNIGLSILWSLGQCGIKDFDAGLKVFQEIMLQLIEMKNYSRYIVKYLINLVKRHDKITINRDQYLLFLEIIFSNKKNFPTDLSKDLHEILPKLKSLLFINGSHEKYHSYIEPLLKKLQNNSNKHYTNELCDILVLCFNKDQTNLNTWGKNYTKHLTGSAVLLNYIETNWFTLSSKFNKKVFKDLLDTYAATNEALMLKKKKDDGLLDCVAAIKKLNNKMVAKKRSGFPFGTVLLVLAFTISAVVLYDVKKSGSWENSEVFKIVKTSGVSDYTHQVYERAGRGVLFVNNYFENNFPEYYQATALFIEPYITLSKDLGLVLYNFFERIRENIIAKYPQLIESIESYAPGLLEQSQKAVTNVVSTSTFYINRSVDYLSKEVFVGQLAPENMQRVVLEAFNTTQQIASKYYHWLYEKVQTTIK